MKVRHLLQLSLSAITCLLSIISDAQIHPLAFGAPAVNANWYKDYINYCRVEITAPSVIAQEVELYTTANNGSGGTGMWGGVVSTPIINVPVVMGAPDTFGCSGFGPGSMTGKIALIWRGNGCEFSYKALQAQNAGAIACVIINNFTGAPTGMGAGSYGSLVTIPVFMIRNIEGIAMTAQYHLLPAGSVKMTITPWGHGDANDLGMVPAGAAAWHNYAIPYRQLAPSGSSMPYKGMNGAFIANYGTHNATNVRVRDTLRFTPSGGGPSIVHTDASPVLAMFQPADSIYAMPDPAEYSFSATGTGRFDLRYVISSDTVDQYPTDNSTTCSFYTTDSVYSKGTYDFVNNVPASAIYYQYGGGSSDFMWGPTYYVQHGGTAISSVQFSLESIVPGPIGLTSMNIYAFKWIDGSGGQPLDGVMQIGELAPASLGVYSFLPTDTSGGVFKVRMGDPTTGVPGASILLDSNSWYYIAAEVPSGYYLGCDGFLSPYPRIYCRYHTSSTLDYSNALWVGDYSSMLSYPGAAEAPCPSTLTTYANSVDSFNYKNEKGLIPSIAMIVNNNPSVITGPASLCVATTVTLSDPLPGGTWSSSNTAVAKVGTTGVVTGISGGTATISYTTFGDLGTLTVTVNPVPGSGVISGATTVCQGAAVILSDGVAGGAWSSSATGIATVNSSGLVAGVATGTATISYSVTNPCGTSWAVRTMTVSATPTGSTISGPSGVCAASTITLSDGISGGVWSSSSTGIATVGSTGVVTGIAAGTAAISYFVSVSCGALTVVKVVTVSTFPTSGSISGPSTVCSGGVMALSDGIAGGVWSSSATGIATTGSTGVVTGVAAGTATISYSVTNACGTSTAIHAITVNAGPSGGSISGPSRVCRTATISLSDGLAGGAWSSSATSIATVGSAGKVTGVAGGTATISYSLTASCGTFTALHAVTVDDLPVIGVITGFPIVCKGDATTLSDSAPGGVWSSSATSVAIVGSTGVVTGIAAGTAVITYTVTNPCGAPFNMMTVTVDLTPTAPPISGSSVVCAGGTITLSDGVPGGTWSSSATSVATVSGGVVSGIAAGTATISYSVFVSCGIVSATQTVTVVSAPISGTISGPSTVCQGGTITLSDGAAGGVWSSSATAVATVSGTGIVSGVAGGTATVSYSVTNLCGTLAATKVVTVNPAPDAGTIIGASTLCQGGSAALSDGISGGAWSSDNTSVATVSGGVVNGIAAGSAGISYTVSNSCGSAHAAFTVTVSAPPADAGIITGPDTVCTGDSIVLANTTTGGAWSSVFGYSTVTGSGVVTGVTAGTDTIVYTVSNSCGSAIAVQAVTVLSASDCISFTRNNVSNTLYEVTVYPNPNEGEFTINVSSVINTDVTFTITNIVGENVKTFTGMTNKNIDVRLDQPGGIYLLSAASQGNKSVSKLVIR
jgi:uncharacterized protein YjdB